MVGEGEKSILRCRREGSREGEGQNASYSRRKKDKKAKFQFKDEVTNDEEERNKMVDIFVHEVIEKAKNEYLSQCANHHGDGGVSVREKLVEGQKKGDAGAEDRLSGKAPKKSGKDKGRRKHHYKYSDPVDAREISAYEAQEGNSLLQMTSQPDGDTPGDDSPPRFYDRTMLTVRRLLGCCLGKT